MNFDSMNYFVEIARTRSFTKAAEHLHITQQSLSAHVAQLEEEVGCQLLVRHIPLELTYGGTIFLKYAENFQREIVTMRKEFCDVTENKRGILRVGVGFTRGRSIMPRLIAAFQQQYPNIEIDLVETSNELLRKALIERDIDLAVANFPASVPGITLSDFYEERLALFVSKDLLCRAGLEPEAFTRALQAGDLSVLGRIPYVMGSPDDVSGRFGYDMLRRAQVRPTIKAKSDNVETLLTLCFHGVGACFCQENLAHALLTSEHPKHLLTYPLGDRGKYMIRFGFHEKAYQWKIVSEFMRVAAEVRKAAQPS